MGFSDADSTKCRRHPNEKQHPGVCSSCLRERLSKLSSNTNTPSSSTRYRASVVSHSSSFSSTPPYSSSSFARHRRNGSDVCVSVGSLFNNGLKKSKSVSCAPLSRSRGGGANSHKSDNKIEKVFDGNSISENFEVEEKVGSRKKKGGFLKRFIHPTGKKA